MKSRPLLLSVLAVIFLATAESVTTWYYIRGAEEANRMEILEKKATEQSAEGYRDLLLEVTSTERPGNLYGIDPHKLVSLANRLAGRNAARLTKIDGNPAIHYRTTNPSQDDPLWSVLLQLRSANALKSVTVVVSPLADLSKQKELKDRMIRLGLPADQVDIRPIDPGRRLHGGIFFSLRPQRKFNL